MNMREQFKYAYRAFRMLGNTPDWKQFDKCASGLEAKVAAGKVYCSRFK